jgi:hypothetical protein
MNSWYSSLIVLIVAVIAVIYATNSRANDFNPAHSNAWIKSTSEGPR